MLLNKWIQFGMSAAIAVSGAAAAIDWTSIVSQKTAASIAGILGVVKMITNALAPAAGMTAAPTGNSVVTHS